MTQQQDAAGRPPRPTSRQQDPAARRRRGAHRRRMGGLVALWLVYWAVLVVAVLWTPVRLFLRLKRELGSGVGLLIDDALRLTVRVDQAVVWSAATTGVEAAAWLFGPPLLLWLVWMWATGRTSRAAGPEPVAGRAAPPVGAADAPALPMPAAPDFAPGGHRAPEPVAVPRAEARPFDDA